MRTERDWRSRARRPEPTGRGRRLRGDGGAIMAEAALLTPFFITLVFGMLEFGGAFRDYLTIANGTSQGARQAAIQGNVSTADWYILHTVVTATSAMPMSQINYIVIYKAGANVTGPPSGCLTAGSAANNCNRYSPTDLANLGTASTPPVNWLANTPDSGSWPAANRVVTVTGPPDWIGIYINTTHPWITGLFGSDITLTNNTVTQLEPQKLS